MNDLRGAILRRLADDEGDKRFGEPYFPRDTATDLNVDLVDVYEAIQGLQGDGLVFLDPAGQGTAGSFDKLEMATIGGWPCRRSIGFVGAA